MIIYNKTFIDKILFIPLGFSNNTLIRLFTISFKIMIFIHKYENTIKIDIKVEHKNSILFKINQTIIKRLNKWDWNSREMNIMNQKLSTSKEIDISKFI